MVHIYLQSLRFLGGLFHQRRKCEPSYGAKVGQAELDLGNIESSRQVNMSKIWLKSIQKHDNLYFWRQEIKIITISGANSKIETRINMSLRSFICWVI